MGGWIYCFVTPSMPGVVKIGATDRDPTERLREARACTWHIPDYEIACTVEVEEPFAAERRIHAALALRRVHPRREFFRATADEARTLITLTTTVGQTIPSVPNAATQSSSSPEATPLNREAPPAQLTPELGFMRATFMYETFGQELVTPHKSARVPWRYVIPSGQLCCEYNRWRAENGLRDQVSNKRFNMKLASHGSAYGITQERTSRCNNFVIDSDTLRAALTRDFGVVA